MKIRKKFVVIFKNNINSKKYVNDIILKVDGIQK